jgi:ubiquinone/menaquinone biosynthesis C-methylase UbiE
MTSKSVTNWILVNGQKFLADIGIRPGQTVLDFGCGEGHYAIPASKLVGRAGHIYAMDKDTEVLDDLKKQIAQMGIKNMALINGYSQIPLPANSVDVVLCYDVVHFMDAQERKIIYQEIYRVLRDSGLFSVYPKHHKKDRPLMELANVALNGVIKEIEDSHFILARKCAGELLHNNSYNQGYVFNFQKGDPYAVD